MIQRREFMRRLSEAVLGTAAFPSILSSCSPTSYRRPNILFAISDDQTWLHAGAYGSRMVLTPHFDRVAEEGVLFQNAFCSAPQCSPCRASILTGRHIWQLEEAGSHASHFPRKFEVFTEKLEQAGYVLGYTGKPWGPGRWDISGWLRNPVGPEYNAERLDDGERSPAISNIDYASNFQEFLDQRPEGDPFFFWFGCTEPHRPYTAGSGMKRGKRRSDAEVPDFLPDSEMVRSDLLDYASEIEWFDTHLGRMLAMLEEIGELDHTLVVVTSDNGMPFPRAKANLYEYGIHLPLAVRWPACVRGGRVVDDLVSFVDFAPTFLEAAGVPSMEGGVGRSFMNVLRSRKEGRVDPDRGAVFVGRERHTHARPDNLSYPSRAIRTDQFLYIRNLHAERWPAGDPAGSGEPEGYHDIDASPTKSYMLEHRDSEAEALLFRRAFGKRPEEELYDILQDPACLQDLAENPDYEGVRQRLRITLEQTLETQGDPRMHGRGDVFESYPRYSRMRAFDGFKTRGEYNPKYQER